MYIDEPIPNCWSWGVTRTPMYRTTVITAASGKTERDQRWKYPQHSYVAPFNNRLQSEVDQLLNYWYSIGGRANTWPLHDHADYKSCALPDTPAGDDQPLGIADIGQTDFQVRKVYQTGSIQQERKITRPIESTLIVWVDGAPVGGWTLEPLGVVRFATPMTGGEVVTAGFEFHVPCAFASDDLDVAIHNRNEDEYISNVGVVMIEDKE